MLLSIGVADAYAIPFEFVKDPDAHGLVNDLQTFQQHPKYVELQPSQYTDDTLRSIATALVVMSNPEDGQTIFDPASYVKAMQLVVSNDRRKGWSKRFQAYIEDNLETHPVHFMRGLTSRAASNGSIMGSLPLGYLKHIQDVKLAAAAQALSTHSAETVRYAQMMALSSWFFLHNAQEDFAGLVAFLNEEVDGGLDSDFAFSSTDLPGRVSMGARDTAEAVLALLYRNESMADILREAVETGGDTDSVAALAVGIASCTTAYAHDLPGKLVNELDMGRGMRYLHSIDRKLGEKL